MLPPFGDVEKVNLTAKNAKIYAKYANVNTCNSALCELYDPHSWRIGPLRLMDLYFICILKLDTILLSRELTYSKSVGGLKSLQEVSQANAKVISNYVTNYTDSNTCNYYIFVFEGACHDRYERW
jgi:hypothetical protein